MRKLVLFMHVSLDGYTAGPNGEMDWIKVDDEMFEFSNQQTNGSDTALYGRGTYKIMQDYWPTAADKPDASNHDIVHSKWYNEVEKIVVSGTLKGTRLSNARIISDNVAGEVQKLKTSEGRDIIMFGSPTLAKTMMQENLIDDYWLFVNPILLGKGALLFTTLKNHLNLKLVSHKALSSGVVCLHYQAITSK